MSRVWSSTGLRSVNEVPAVIDVARVLVGFGVVAGISLVLGVMLGRRVAPDFRKYVQRMEEFMTTITEKLTAGLAEAGTKIDALAVIVVAQADVLKRVEDQLRAMKDAPTSTQVDTMLTEISAHIAGLAAAVKKLDEADDEPAQPAPAIDPSAIQV